MNPARKPNRSSLVSSLSALIPEVGPLGKVVIEDREVRCQVRALRDALRAAFVDWNATRKAIGRLRAIYLESLGETFPNRLVAVLRRISQSYPSLKGVVYRNSAAKCFQGSPDLNARFGFAPQHRSRFRR